MENPSDLFLHVTKTLRAEAGESSVIPALDQLIESLMLYRSHMTAWAQSDKLVSSIRSELRGGHVHLTVFVRGGNAGMLIVAAPDAVRIMARLKDQLTELNHGPDGRAMEMEIARLMSTADINAESGALTGGDHGVV